MLEINKKYKDERDNEVYIYKGQNLADGLHKFEIVEKDKKTPSYFFRNISDFTPYIETPRTIEDVQKGDLIQIKNGYYRVFAVIDEFVITSCSWKKGEKEEINKEDALVWIKEELEYNSYKIIPEPTELSIKEASRELSKLKSTTIKVVCGCK